MPKIITLGVIALAAVIVVAADGYAPAADGEREIVRRPLPTPLSGPTLSKLSPGLGVDLGTIPWTESNIETLHAANMADVRRFLNGNIQSDISQRIMPPENVTEFSWVDLEGNGRYTLIMVQMPAVCHVCNSVLLICQHNGVGRTTIQVLPGTYPLTRAIRDINGDGKKELIIPPPALHPDWEGFGAITEIIWPRVYRLENGKYTEASSEFPSYYDAEVLPPIENAISEARFRIANGPIGAKPTARWLQYMHRKVAGLTMERDKILRVIGRDPEAGLRQAREWMSNPDAALVQDAITVFKDMGGHDNDLRAATDRLKEEGCDVNGFGPSALRGDRAESDWLVYTNAKNGLSFRYPPPMRVEERDPATFHFDHPPQVIVDVAGPATGLRFMCAADVKSAELLRELGQPSSEDQTLCASMRIDGHEAIVGGRNFGQWSVTILEPRVCDIFPTAAGAGADLSDDLPPPHDAKFPLLSIVRTVHFESVPSRH